jgi:hypothetical protein
MSTSFANAAWPACLSSLRLDRWIAGELAPRDAEDVRAHVAACARCGAAAESLRAGRDVALPPLGAAAPEPRGASRIRRLGGVLGLAGALAAAAVLVFVRAGGPRERTKGPGVSLAMYVQHGEAIRRAGPGEVVAPGDALRFAVTAPAPAFVAVLSVDAAGRASVYFPAGARAEPVTAGTDVPLPLATRLDATLGRERVVGLFCDHPALLEPVRAALEGTAADAVPAGCTVTRWDFEKR